MPLVVPEINPEDAKKHNGIIANPNCSTIISMVAALRPWRSFRPSSAITASTYQAVSGAGAGGLAELEAQVRAYAAGEATLVEDASPTRSPSTSFPRSARTCENGYTTEEMKMQNEGRKILHLPEMKVTCTCVRVPVLRSHSISLSVRTRRKISVAAAREAIAAKRQGLQSGGRPGKRNSTPCRWTPAIRTWSTSAASATT